MGVIDFEDVAFAYPNGFVAVEGVSFSIAAGESVAVVGQNGAGKTTVAKMCNGLLRPSSGRVLVDGAEAAEKTCAQLARTVGYVFQNPDDQIFHNTVSEEVAFGPKALGMGDERARESVLRAARLAGLEAHMGKNPYDLPLSQRKLVTIASVVAMDCAAFVFDEPTAGQDRRGIELLSSLTRALVDEGRAVVTITHDMEYAAANCGRVIVMAHGRIQRIGSPQKVFSDRELLARAMLTPPFVRALADDLGLGGEFLSQGELIDRLLREREACASGA